MCSSSCLQYKKRCPVTILMTTEQALFIESLTHTHKDTTYLKWSSSKVESRDTLFSCDTRCSFSSDSSCDTLCSFASCDTVCSCSLISCASLDSLLPIPRGRLEKEVLGIVRVSASSPSASYLLCLCGERDHMGRVTPTHPPTTYPLSNSHSTPEHFRALIVAQFFHSVLKCHKQEHV